MMNNNSMLLFYYYNTDATKDFFYLFDQTGLAKI